MTTTETGLADDLRGHPLVTLTVPGDPASLADGLRCAMDWEPGGGAAYPSGTEGYAKTDVVDWWLRVTGAASDPSGASPPTPSST